MLFYLSSSCKFLANSGRAFQTMFHQASRGFQPLFSTKPCNLALCCLHSTSRLLSLYLILLFATLFWLFWRKLGPASSPLHVLQMMLQLLCLLPPWFRISAEPHEHPEAFFCFLFLFSAFQGNKQQWEYRCCRFAR